MKGHLLPLLHPFQCLWVLTTVHNQLIGIWEKHFISVYKRWSKQRPISRLRLPSFSTANWTARLPLNMVGMIQSEQNVGKTHVPIWPQNNRNQIINNLKQRGSKTDNILEWYGNSWLHLKSSSQKLREQNVCPTSAQLLWHKDTNENSQYSAWKQPVFSTGSRYHNILQMLTKRSICHNIFIYAPSPNTHSCSVDWDFFERSWQCLFALTYFIQQSLKKYIYIFYVFDKLHHWTKVITFPFSCSLFSVCTLDDVNDALTQGLKIFKWRCCRDVCLAVWWRPSKVAQQLLSKWKPAYRDN